MHIVHLVAEFSPVIKVGGIADVLQGLAQETIKKGHNLEVFLPKYDSIHQDHLTHLHVECPEFKSFFEGKWHKNTLWKGFFHDVPIYFIESHNKNDFFNRGMVYGCDDDVRRFLYFCRAVLDYLSQQKICPEIFHLHDWHTAITGPLYYDLFQEKMVGEARIVFTIHNLEYQGHTSTKELDAIGLKGSHYLCREKLQDNYNPQAINLLKGGVVYSNYVTTVSPQYALEAITPEGGRGLDPTLLQYQEKFSGVLNAIDTSYWDPKTDPNLPSHYTAKSSYSKIKKAKASCKQKLSKRFSLEGKNSPLIICISRLVPQKGLDLIKHTLERAKEHNCLFFLLGESLIPEVQREFLDIKKAHEEHPLVHLELDYCEDLAHLVYAAGDMIIVPSLFEPCGLVQMIGMQYGTVPIARNTGGLVNTVFDVDYDLSSNEKNGYVFETPDKQGLDSALLRAIEDFRTQEDKWSASVKNGMSHDWSWHQSIEKLLNIYQKIHS